MSKKVKTKVKRKFSKKKTFIFLSIICIIVLVIKYLNTNITNIYISGNTYLTDQEIIDISKLSSYPNSISNLSFTIEKRLEKNKYIYKSKVKKNILLNKVYIEVIENYPLFYYTEKNKTILYNGEEADDNLTSIVVTNYVPNEEYNKLITSLKKINTSILNRISEIEYSPNERYNDRFLLLMSDGNYVYITLEKFTILNKYLDVIKYIDSSEKGIIRLDSGEYFDKFDD